MLLSYLYPFPIRRLEAPLLWVFYRQLAAFRESDVAYIGSPEYFGDPGPTLEQRPWEANPETQARLRFEIPTFDETAGVRRHVVDASLFDPLLSEIGSGMRAWASLMTRPYPPLCRRLTEIFRAARKQGRIEAVMTFCNCASLQKVAKKFRVPVIHNEQGALRAPLFQPTVYFDFQGVNGNTETAARYQRFRREVDRAGMPLLTIEELWQIMAGATPMEPPTDAAGCDYELGLPLQVEDDSNLIAFGNGYSNFELLQTALQFAAVEKTLVRQHPSGSLDYFRAGWNPIQIDWSPTSLDFIRHSRRIATINSSVALESMMAGRPTCILGQSPFDFMAVRTLAQLFQAPASPSSELRTQLNFALLGYLVPEVLLFHFAYYRWRLQRPSEREIFSYHLDFYRTHPAQRVEVAPPAVNDLVGEPGSEQSESSAA